MNQSEVCDDIDVNKAFACYWRESKSRSWIWA